MIDGQLHFGRHAEAALDIMVESKDHYFATKLYTTDFPNDPAISVSSYSPFLLPRQHPAWNFLFFKVDVGYGTKIIHNGLAV